MNISYIKDGIQYTKHFNVVTEITEEEHREAMKKYQPSKCGRGLIRITDFKYIYQDSYILYENNSVCLVKRTRFAADETEEIYQRRYIILTEDTSNENQ